MAPCDICAAPLVAMVWTGHLVLCPTCTSLSREMSPQMLQFRAEQATRRDWVTLHRATAFLSTPRPAPRRLREPGQVRR